MNHFKNNVFKFITATLIVMVSGHASAQKYLFYLHGQIVENMGAKAVSPTYGAYEYDAILDTFRKAGFTVVSEVRKPDTDIRLYATQVESDVNDLIAKGTAAKNITVVGASKGALIAMAVSTLLKNKDINFVFLAACNDNNYESYPNIRFYGNILSIYEKSDDIGKSCRQFKSRSSEGINHYKEIVINTGLQHGFLFRPLPDWIKPTIAWANGNYD